MNPSKSALAHTLAAADMSLLAAERAPSKHAEAAVERTCLAIALLESVDLCWSERRALKRAKRTIALAHIALLRV